MTTTDDILKECKDIQAFLETAIENDVNALAERSTFLAVYHARTGQMLADAKFLQRKKKADDISSMLFRLTKKADLSKTVQNALVGTYVREESYAVEWCDRLNSCCCHQLDLIRTLISKEKEEMKFANYQK